jgi:hypothetical protein
MKKKTEDEKKSAKFTGEEGATSFDNLLALGQMDAIANGGHASDVTAETVGHKFQLPDLPLKPLSNRKERYDPVVTQVTKLIMEHGKLSAAQRVSPPIPTSQTLARRTQLTPCSLTSICPISSTTSALPHLQYRPRPALLSPALRPQSNFL